MIRLVSGRRGSGKTTVCVQEMVALCKVGGLRPVCTNIGITYEFRKLCGRRLIELEFDQVPRFFEYSPPGSDIYLDETTLHFDARAAMENQRKNPELTKYLMHVRKFDDNVTFICHDFEHVDKRLRELADVYTLCMSSRAIFRGFHLPFADRIPEFFIIRDYQYVDMTGHLHTQIVFGCKGLWKYFISKDLRTAAGLKRLQQLRVMKEDEEKIAVDGEERAIAVSAGGYGRFLPWAALIGVGVFLGCLV